MRLTNEIRDAFISGAMQDVPNIEYKEQMRKIILDAAITVLPERVKAIYKDYSAFIRTDYVSFMRVSVAIPTAHSTHPSTFLNTKEIALLEELDQKSKEQELTRRQLQQRLKSAAYSCNTRKQLVELLPAFEKYLPADEITARTKNLPAIADIYPAFVAAGWPKGSKPKTIKESTK